MKQLITFVFLVPLFFVMSCQKKDVDSIDIMWQSTDNPKRVLCSYSISGASFSANNEKYIEGKRYIEVWSNETMDSDKKLFHVYFRGEMNDESETMDIHISSEYDFKLSFMFLDEDKTIQIEDVLSGTTCETPTIFKSGKYHFTATKLD